MDLLFPSARALYSTTTFSLLGCYRDYLLCCFKHTLSGEAAGKQVETGCHQQRKVQQQRTKFFFIHLDSPTTPLLNRHHYRYAGRKEKKREYLFSQRSPHRGEKGKNGPATVDYYPGQDVQEVVSRRFPMFLSCEPRASPPAIPPTTNLGEASTRYEMFC